MPNSEPFGTPNEIFHIKELKFLKLFIIYYINYYGFWNKIIVIEKSKATLRSL